MNADGRKENLMSLIQTKNLIKRLGGLQNHLRVYAEDAGSERVHLITGRDPVGIKPERCIQVRSGGNLETRYEGKAQKSKPGLEDSERDFDLGNTEPQDAHHRNQGQRVEASRTADEGLGIHGTHSRYGTHTTWVNLNTPLKHSVGGVGWIGRPNGLTRFPLSLSTI